MAKLDADSIPRIFAPHLEVGEELEHFAYGIRQPHFAVVALLLCLAVLPGLLIVAYLTRGYLVGKTSRRIVVLEVSGKGEVRRTIEYALDEFHGARVETSSGANLTRVRVDIPDKAFAAKFHRAFAPFNRAGALAIAAAVDRRAAPADVS